MQDGCAYPKLLKPVQIYCFVTVLLYLYLKVSFLIFQLVTCRVRSSQVIPFPIATSKANGIDVFTSYLKRPLVVGVTDAVGEELVLSDS